VTSDELIDRLRAEVPEHEIDPVWLEDDGEGPLTYPIVSELRDWLLDEGPDAPHAAFDRAWALIERGFLEGDDEVRTLLSIELFEGTEWPEPARARMAPKTAEEEAMSALAMRAFHGEATREEVDAVARRLRRGPQLEPLLDVGAALYVLGATRATEHRGLVESFLAHDDPAVVLQALRVLCLHWEERDRYEHHLQWLAETDVPEQREAATELLGFVRKGRKRS
jgi:hypothetical protein